MTLHDYFKDGLSVDAYTRLLNEDQKKLHENHERRADIDSASIDAIRNSGPHHVLVITEPWCGDSLAIFPVIAKLFTEAGCEVRVVQRDAHPELIDQFLTNGGRAIPIAVVLDEAFNERFHWGPRPAPAQSIVIDSKPKIAAGDIDKIEVHKKVRAFYAQDNGQSIVAEFVTKLAG